MGFAELFRPRHFILRRMRTDLSPVDRVISGDSFRQRQTIPDFLVSGCLFTIVTIPGIARRVDRQTISDRMGNGSGREVGLDVVRLFRASELEIGGHLRFAIGSEFACLVGV